MSFQSVFNSVLDFTDAFVTGYNAMAGGVPNGNHNMRPHGTSLARDRIEGLCRQLHWAVDERQEDQILLHFNHPQLGTRKVVIFHGDADLVTFAVFSGAYLPARSVPTEVLGHLPTRNKAVSIGGWHVSVGDNGTAFFIVLY